MDTSKLKTFAQSARRQLLAEVAARLEQVLRLDTIETREKQAAITELREQIAQSSRQAVIDRAAYTWFNRFCALRFMDVNRYTRLGIVSPQEGYTQPEILQEAKQGVIDAGLKVDRKRVLDILSGKIPSNDPQGEAYRLLLVGACNETHQLMPFLFEPIADYTELLIPGDLLSENSVLHQLRQVLTAETCQDVEVIGWLYQFYISERKDEVFENLKKNIKIEAKDIPAATQLFTPHWIVRYLVENSLGRLWMLNHPESKLVAQMDYYIQPVQEETDFLKIESPEEIKVCDPACGSGHMLTYAFDLLYAIYEEQGYEPAQIPSLVLGKNLYGIEIDQRAGDLAAFALVMKARARDKRFFSRGIEPNICVLQNVSFTAEEINAYMKAVGNDLFTQDLWVTLKQFEQADNFGSLIQPQLKDVAFVCSRLEEKKVIGNLFLHNTNRKVQQVLEQSQYLAPRYHVVVTNPPYMGSNSMGSETKKFFIDQFPASKSDLFAMFIERNIELAYANGFIGMITMQSWMFLSSFEQLRKELFQNYCIISMAHFGPGAFDTIGGEVVSTTAFVIRKAYFHEHKGCYFRLIDGSDETEKERILRESIQTKYYPRSSNFFIASSKDFEKIPGMPIAYWASNRVRDCFQEFTNIRKLGSFKRGLATGDNDRFLRYWFEVSQKNTSIFSYQNDPKWFKYNKGGGFRKWYGNLELLVNWANDGNEIRNFFNEEGKLKSRPQNTQYNFQPVVTYSSITSGNLSIRLFDGGIINDQAGNFFPAKDIILLQGIAGFLNSKIATYLINILNPTMNILVEDLNNLPVTFEYSVSSTIESRVKKLCLYAENDWDSYETSWGFKKNHLLSQKAHRTNICNAYFTNLRFWKETIEEVKSLEEENNRYFIEAYFLQNEITPDVPLQEITLTCNPYYRYGINKSENELEALLLADTMKEFISYSVGCMFGRYSLDKPGLILANQGETAQDYRRLVPQPSFPPDEDNVIPILEAGWFNDDIVERFKKFLRLTFGDDHFEENLSFIESAIGRDIRSYFLKEFYSEHVKMYKSRPIYWLFSSPSGSFNALIYLHRCRPDTVSVILNDYLREYIRKLTAHKAHLEQVSLRLGGTQAEKTKATKEINALNKVLAELKEYEDEVLYPLATRQVQLDLDDGVKVNYKKFGKALKVVKGLSE
ncbi:MAG: BREX-1 system adenine-specific DNA-methyltransferase PglX [Anaerolineales bacterium]|jgi:type II restriction/modification system DNA methylase subunit YeeA|nr:BREX-1 system adenine-specific DNA-methyltransferase PglX [Anaerolineales bacterium]